MIQRTDTASELRPSTDDEKQNGGNMNGINNKPEENSKTDISTTNEINEAGATSNTENSQADNNRARNGMPDDNINIGGGMAGWSFWWSG